jgi:hypothetical protein
MYGIMEYLTTAATITHKTLLIFNRDLARSQTIIAFWLPWDKHLRQIILPTAMASFMATTLVAELHAGKAQEQVLSRIIWGEISMQHENCKLGKKS